MGSGGPNLSMVGCGWANGIGWAQAWLEWSWTGGVEQAQHRKWGLGSKWSGGPVNGGSTVRPTASSRPGITDGAAARWDRVGPEWWHWSCADGFEGAQEWWSWSWADGIGWPQRSSWGHGSMVSGGPKDSSSRAGPTVLSGPDVVDGALAR
jgi:hypothetical protein